MSDACLGRTRCRTWGLPHTLLLPSGVMQNFLASAQYVADQGVLYGMTGETPISYIDTRDVAAVAAQVLTSPGHQGKAYTLTGPEALSGDEVHDGRRPRRRVTDEVARLIGGQPRTFAQFAAERRVVFGGQQ